MNTKELIQCVSILILAKSPEFIFNLALDECKSDLEFKQMMLVGFCFHAILEME